MDRDEERTEAIIAALEHFLSKDPDIEHVERHADSVIAYYQDLRAMRIDISTTTVRPL